MLTSHWDTGYRDSASDTGSIQATKGLALSAFVEDLIERQLFYSPVVV
jgi:hypothetical protein